MGRPKSKGVDTAGGGGEEHQEEEKARPAIDPLPHDPMSNNVRKAQEGEAGTDPPAPAPVPAPAPRKRGRPRKVVPKVEENAALPPQLSATAVTDAGSKKQKVESPSPTSNRMPPIEHTLTSIRPSTRAPLRREGSRRKSEPRRAAD